ncbi:MAG: hypothetical protein ABIV10_09055 [Gemmatimonadaceae bacterium]
MSQPRRWLIPLVGLAICATVIALRSHPAVAFQPDPQQFLDEGREGTRRYESQQEAINDGFTRVGVEFPAMGEHWVSFARVMLDTVDAIRPSVLIYANTRDGPRLAGIAYTKLVPQREVPPVFPFADAWHEHSGAVAEESLPLGHSSHGRATGSGAMGTHGDSPRFFILHAWVWTSNPDGPFATDNWALPLARLGIASAGPAPRDAIRALALAEDGDGYHRTIMSASLQLSAHEDSVLGTLLRQRRLHIEPDVRTIRQAGTLGEAESARLAGTWDSLWTELQIALPSRAHALRQLRARM